MMRGKTVMPRSASFGDTRDPLERAIDRAHTESIIRNATRQGREIALDAAIKVCEAVVATGGSALDCVRRLRQFQHESQ